MIKKIKIRIPRMPFWRKVLPKLLAVVTGRKRYLPKLDFNWRGNITHSLLMCYYAVFWRRWGIASGGLSFYQDSTGKRVVWATTWFGSLQFLEHEIIRPALEELIFKWKTRKKLGDFFGDLDRLFAPEFALVTPFGSIRGQDVPEFNKHFYFAIAFNEGEGTASGTSTTPTLSNVEGAGSDRWLAVHLNFGATTVSAVPAFGGSNTTIISTNVNTSDGNPNISAYRLIAPSTTTGDLTASLSASVFWIFMATTYTGVDQTTSTADEDNNSANVAPGSPVTYTCTSDLNGSWMFMTAKSDSGAANVTFTSPAVVRQGEDANPINVLGDNPTETNSGSNRSIEVSHAGGAQRLGAIFCMIRPAVVEDRNVNVSDTTNVTESVTRILESFVNVNDQVNIEDIADYYKDELLLVESVEVFLFTGAIDVSGISDSVNVSESVSIYMGIDTSNNDTVNVTENIQADMTSYLSVNSQVSISEDISRLLESNLSVSDQINISEDVALNVPGGLVNVSDAINVSENISVTSDVGGINVSDLISIGEDISVFLQSFLNVNDAITLSENFSPTGTSNLSVSDDFTISESVTVESFKFAPANIRPDGRRR